jgi:dethiobiotin synthetase
MCGDVAGIVFGIAKIMTAAFFITSTGTGIGKTLVTTALCWQLKQRDFNVTALKPVISGFDGENVESDSALILKSCGLNPTPQMMKTISPWQFAAPLSPHLAAHKEKKFIVFEEVVEFCEEHAAMQSGIVLVEGAGGIMTPLDDRHTMLDVAERLRWPVILVCGSYLGAISHTLTALDTLKTRAIPVAAIVVSESEESGVSLNETVEGLSPFVPSITIVKLPHARPDVELWKHVANISWICAEIGEKNSHV